MANDARRVGSAFETDTLGYLREHGVGAERLARAGKLDEGDLAVAVGGKLYVFELKARRDRNSSLNLGAWLEEAHREAAKFRDARGLETTPQGLLVVKRPRKSIGQAFVIMELEQWLKTQAS